MSTSRGQQQDAVRALLIKRGQATALELSEELEVSRPTISRLLSQLGDEVLRFGAARHARYALRRTLGTLGHSWPIYEVEQSGTLRLCATLEAAQGGFRLQPIPPLLREDYPDGFFSGLPFLFDDIRPLGFLGRVQAKRVAASVGASTDPREWTPQDILAYLIAYGDDLPGSWVIGEEMAERIRRNEVGTLTETARTSIPVALRDQHYPVLADKIIRGESFGSSTGGEQPKFACWVADEGGPDGGIPRAVIVKFSPETKVAAGLRWADLLVAEFHALNVLRRHGVATPEASLHYAGSRRFLEISRYDRVGLRGRRAVISLASLEAGLIDGKNNQWIDAANQMEAAGLLNPRDAQTLRQVYCFGTLIGNTDMHFGNVSLWWRDERPLGLAPVYDMLPMVFAPTSQGELVDRPFPTPNRAVTTAENWAQAETWALEFWEAVIADREISEEFRTKAVQAHAHIRKPIPVERPFPPTTPPSSADAFEKFTQRFPTVAQALTEQKKKSEVRPNPEQRPELKREMEAALEWDLAPVVTDLFGAAPTPDSMAQFSQHTYAYLGTGDHVRLFMGNLWADVLATWSETERAGFMERIVSPESNVFQTLDFARETFLRLPFTAEFMGTWLRAGYRRVQNDLYQHGFWKVVDAFARGSPSEAAKVVSMGLTSEISDFDRSILAVLLAALRSEVRTKAAPGADILRIEENLRSKGRASWRALYLQSRAVSAERPLITEQEALELRDQLGREGPLETASWCHLVCNAIVSDPANRAWGFRELVAASHEPSTDGKYWVIVASTRAWEEDREKDPISRAEWESLLMRTLPYQPEDRGLWNHLGQFLRTVGREEPARLLPVIRGIVHHVGDAWLTLLGERSPQGLLGSVAEAGLKAQLPTSLMLGNTRAERKAGLFLFFRTPGADVAEDLVAAAEPRTIELIFREAQAGFHYGAALGRLHAGLAAAIERIGGAVREEFYQEVAQQAISTGGYRDAIASQGEAFPRIKAILGEVDALWEKWTAAVKSPVFQMQVPGGLQALDAFHQRFSRELDRQVEQRSVFLSFVKKVRLLYGDKWRMMHDYGLSGASPLQVHSQEVEIPRLEFMDPGGRRLTRTEALSRIMELEGNRT